MKRKQQSRNALESGVFSDGNRRKIYPCNGSNEKMGTGIYRIYQRITTFWDFGKRLRIGTANRIYERKEGIALTNRNL